MESGKSWKRKNGLYNMKTKEWRMVWNILICAYLQICDMLSVPRHDTRACAFTFVTRSNCVTVVAVVFFFFQPYQSVSITCSMSYFDHITKNH